MNAAKRIFVNTGNLQENNKDGKRRPVMACEVWRDGRKKQSHVCFDIEIKGPSRMVYESANGKNGFVYMQTYAEVQLLLVDGQSIAV